MEGKLQALKVVDLKKLLQDSALPASGAKADLVKRLLENPAATASLAAEEEDLLAEGTEYDGAAAAPAPATAEPDSATAAPAAPTSSEPAVKAASSTVQNASNGQAPPVATESTTAPVKDEATIRAETIAELEKRKARAQRWGMPTDEIDAKLKQIEQNGIQSDENSISLAVLDGELKTKGRREMREEKRTAQRQGRQQRAPLTEEEKAARLARQQVDDEAKKQRADRFGGAKGNEGAATATPPAPLDPVEEEKKRKRMERFGLNAAEPTDKKVKT